jgi:hypothetical protein
MSIYRSGGRVDRYGVLHDPAADKAAAPVNAQPSDPSASSQDWSKLRKAQPAEILLPIGKKLLDQLPPKVFPSALATHYPRIVNLIALQWNDPNSCPKFFKELLDDQRDGRQGFPAPVRRDLENLRAYWYGVAPSLEA